MRTGKLKLLLIVACVLALGAGVFAGMVVSRLPGSTMQQELPVDHSVLSDELQLSDQQRDAMRVIWEGVRSNVHETSDNAQALQKQRDDAIIAILTPEQRKQYETLTREAADKFAALSAKKDKIFNEAVEKTKKLLDDSQREKYDRILRDRIGAVPPSLLAPTTPATNPDLSPTTMPSGVGM